MIDELKLDWGRSILLVLSLHSINPHHAMASPGSSRLSALHTAAARGNLAAMRLVLEHGSIRDAEDGIDARSTDTNGDTVLHVAAAHSRWPVVSWLVANGGGDPDIRNVAGHTALESVPTAEGKDVYVAILGRAVSPRAKRTARRIAASPETTNWKELQTTTNAENSGVPEKQPPPRARTASRLPPVRRPSHLRSKHFKATRPRIWNKRFGSTCTKRGGRFGILEATFPERRANPRLDTHLLQKHRW